MSNTIKTLIIALIVIVVLGLGWKFYVDKSVSDINKSADVPLADENQAASGNQDDLTGTPISAKDSSDASLDKDLSNIDSQLDILSSDSASVDQGLNDKPIPPAE